VPVVGGFLKRMMLAGESLQRAHAVALLHPARGRLPATMILLLVVHITLIRLQGVTEFKFRDEKGRAQVLQLLPRPPLTELILGLVLMILLSALATILPAAMGPKADPLTTPEVIKPEWFFYVTFRWLKLFSGTRPCSHGPHRLRDVRLAVDRRAGSARRPRAPSSASGSASSRCASPSSP
jgi:quinol-cytochrome oxidoreductase complex cytochrome b subunit